MSKDLSLGMIWNCTRELSNKSSSYRLVEPCSQLDSVQISEDQHIVLLVYA